MVSLALEPAEERRRVEHCGEEERGCRGKEEDGSDGCGVEHALRACFSAESVSRRYGECKGQAIQAWVWWEREA